MLITVVDDEHSLDEERYITIGLSNQARLLMVAHTERVGNVRVISARKATSHEERFYAEADDPNDYDLRDEYDLSKMTILPRGRFAPERRVGTNVVVLAPDVSQAFPSDEAVNEALRLVLQIARLPSMQHGEPAPA